MVISVNRLYSERLNVINAPINFFNIKLGNIHRSNQLIDQLRFSRQLAFAELLCEFLFFFVQLRRSLGTRRVQQGQRGLDSCQERCHGLLQGLGFSSVAECDQVLQGVSDLLCGVTRISIEAIPGIYRDSGTYFGTSRSGKVRQCVAKCILLREVCHDDR